MVNYSTRTGESKNGADDPGNPEGRIDRRRVLGEVEDIDRHDRGD